MIEQGAQAPDFTLPDQNGNDVTLSALRGSTVVLYFYPRADTPGCTTQACSIRDHSSDYADAGVTVLGVSPDTVADVKSFHDKFSLDFTLLADAGHAVADAYGTWMEKTNYGKTSMGIERSAFVIDADGNIAKILRRVDPDEHADKVLAALAEL